MVFQGRRDFLIGGGVAIGALATQGCAVQASVPGASAVPSLGGTGTQVSSFGWEATNLNGNGANTYVKILNNMLLQTVNTDISAAILNTKDGTGFAEVLCTGAVSRQAVPNFYSSAQAYVNLPASSNFGSIIQDNPNNLSIVTGGMVADQFLAVILKTWVPTNGSACATSRQVLVYPSLTLNAGDYLVFHMDHQGVAVDAEMQNVFTYILT